MRTPGIAHSHVCVWIDHREAKIFGIGLETAGESVVREPSPHHHIHRKAGQIGEGKAPPGEVFFGTVAAAIAGAHALLLGGPGTAKTELAVYLRRHRPELASRIWGIEPMDHPSDPDIVHAARTFFRAAGRMHG